MLPLEESQRALHALRQRIIEAEDEFAAAIDAVPEGWRESSRNLVHYLGLRRSDIRLLQIQLSTMGLSTLGRLEAHVLAGIDAVLFALAHMMDQPPRSGDDRDPPLEFRQGDLALAQHTRELLGPPCGERLVRIMVTMPAESAHDYELVRSLVDVGTNVMRINSAHDDPAAWGAMIAHTRRAADESGRECRVLFDLCGPKLRTGAIEPGPAVVRSRPERDQCGRVVVPSLTWLGPEPPLEDEPRPFTHIPIEPGFVESARPGDTVRLRDLRDRKRTLRVIACDAGGVWVECDRTVYAGPGLSLRLRRDQQTIAEGRVTELPTLRGGIPLEADDRLILTADPTPGRPAQRGESGQVTEPARVPCTLTTVFADAEVGDPILFDDGKFAGVIENVDSAEIVVRIQRTPPGGAKLREDKGINLPDTHISAPALAEDDIANLDFIAEHVDIVGLSFVRDPADIERLQSELHDRGRDDIAIVLKIETRAAFENLPNLLLAGLRSPPFGVMVARGDLGVEMGFDRLAEVQEQILWLCEAAHVPVIWATQVLETLVKTGMPSRAEVTDAAMSSRAECVMLNKGPFIVEGVRFLDQVLLRMREHHHKKTPMLRRLKVSEGRYGLTNEQPTTG